MPDEKSDKSEEKVSKRAGEGDESHAPLVPFEVFGVDWDGFGAAENWHIEMADGVEKINTDGDQDRHVGVDVFERVKSEAAGILGSMIAKPISHYAVS